ncbi:SDR family NAD(P)-dependent oxidoreductase [Mycobacterium sp. 3519A]|jgi:3-oxoacyl-[acyl-carrier protein] reductase|uniref:SDR family NAD(P)-dependent oxidoreductase n=1 Tax=Mycobacterium sp. 3519A TaxID=2057184 RepID=UPI000C7DB881|nr:SDR family oxidoreductase [Mycobacterium sp. 3519A]
MSTRKVAIVTGAGRNIGRDIALALGEHGIAVAVVDRDAGLAKEVADELVGLHGDGSAVPVACDVTDEAQVVSMVAEAAESLGGVHYLVNNVAATDRGATVLDLSLPEWNTIFEICVTSTFLCTKWAARRMVDQKSGGAIVNIGSTSGYYGRANALAYPMAKSALFGLTKSMAIQLGPHGIRVNLVAPNRAGSPVGQSEINPARKTPNLIGRAAEPADVARVVRFLLSDEAGFVTGADLLVDGGALLVGTGN